MIDGFLLKKIDLTVRCRKVDCDNEFELSIEKNDYDLLLRQVIKHLEQKGWKYVETDDLHNNHFYCPSCKED
jgi:hypothetical protein